jgi:type IV secretion system protein TrbL
MNSGILTEMLTRFTEVATLGYTALLPEAMYLMNFFIVIEIVLLGVFWALGSGNITVNVIQKITAIGAFLWIISNAQKISKAIISSLGELGMVAGGQSVSIADLFDPSTIVGFGFTATYPIFKNTGGVWSAFTSPVDSILFAFCGIIILFSYFVIGWNIFITIIEFYLFTVCSVILIPFALFKPTSFLAQKAINGTFGLGIKFMVLGFIISISYNTLKTLSIPDDPTYHQLFSMVLGSGAISYLCWHAPSMASTIISGGSPNLSIGGVYGALGSATGTAIKTSTAVRSQGVAAVQQAVNMGSSIMKR